MFRWLGKAHPAKALSRLPLHSGNRGKDQPIKRRPRRPPQGMIRQSRRRVPDRQRPRTLIFQFAAIEALWKIVGKWEDGVDNFDGVQRAAVTRNRLPRRPNADSRSTLGCSTRAHCLEFGARDGWVRMLSSLGWLAGGHPYCVAHRLANPGRTVPSLEMTNDYWMRIKVDPGNCSTHRDPINILGV